MSATPGAGMMAVPIVDRAIRVALIGCGRIAKNHFESIARVDGLELVSVCDIVEERAREAGEQNRVPWFVNIEEMLATVPSDAVVVATPSGLHPAHGIIAAKAGRHVIAEKPMAISLAAADALVQACDDNGVKLFVVKQNRLNQR